MPTSRPWVATVALLAVASGCHEGSSDSGPPITLYPILNERGLITYVTTDPATGLAEEDDRLAQEQQQQADEAERQRRRELGWEALTRYRQAQQARREEMERKREEWRRADELVAQTTRRPAPAPRAVSWESGSPASEVRPWPPDSFRAPPASEPAPSLSPPMTAPGPAYYVGNSLPGTSYPSYSPTPTAIPGQSTYIGSTLPGTSYPSYANEPTAIPGQTFYIGNSLPGSSYPTYTTTGTGSVGGYGYGTPPPGSNPGGQAGNGRP